MQVEEDVERGDWKVEERCYSFKRLRKVQSNPHKGYSHWISDASEKHHGMTLTMHIKWCATRLR